MDTFGFIITRHVNSEKTNKYWNNCIKLLRTFYPYKKIVIIDDNSNYEYVRPDFNYKNIEIIQSEFPGRGELLPYYYYLKNKFFQNAIIIHDSVFFHKRVNFENLNGIKVIPLWSFGSDTENVDNTLRIAKNLKNDILRTKLKKEVNILGFNNDKWSGCFGVQSYINYNFLESINNKYGIINLLPVVNCRADRCCLERIFGAIFSSENPQILLHRKSLFGDIMSYYKWGYTFDEYVSNFKKGTIPRYVVKVWTGR